MISNKSTSAQSAAVLYMQDLLCPYMPTLLVASQASVHLRALTWHSNPLLLTDESIDGHNVKGSVDEGAEPGHGFIPEQ